MNNFKFIVLLATILGSSSLFAQVFDAAFAPLDFSGGSGKQTLLNGATSNNVSGAKVLYTNVITIGLFPIDCIVTNIDGTNTFDVGSTTPSIDEMFIPYVTSLNGFKYFRFEFILGGSYNNGTYQPVVLENVYMNVYDIDGGSDFREQVRIESDYSQYELFASSANLTGTRSTLDADFYWQNSSGNPESSYTDIVDDRNRVRVTFTTLSELIIGLGTTNSKSNSNASNFYLAFSQGTGSVTPVINNSINIDLNTNTVGSNNQQDYTICNSTINFSNGNPNISATSTALTNLTVSYNTADIISANNEFIVIGSTSLNLSSTTGSGTVTVSNVNYGYNFSNNTSLGRTSIIFTKTNLTLSEAEALLDAIQLKITNCNTPAGSRVFGVNATLDLTTDIQSPTVFFVANLPQALPVNVISFTGKALENANQLNWTVAQEVDFSHYEVLRSEDGREFNTVGTVFATENSMDMKSYSFTDASAKSEVSYYKLKLVDNNGSVAYTSLVVVSRNAIVPTVSNLFPNPATTQVNIEVQGVSVDNFNVSVQDINGKIVYQANQVSALSNVYQMDVTNFNRGVYVIRIEDEMGNVSVSRFAVSK